MDNAKIRKKLKAAGKKAETGKKTKGFPKDSSNREAVEIPALQQKDGRENAAARSPHAGVTPEKMPSAAEEPLGAGGGPEGEGPDGHAEDTIEVLAFRLSGKDYAFRVTDVEEILNEYRITLVPRAAPFLSGITSVRGKVLPVLDMERRLSLPKGGKTSRPKMVVLKGPKGPVGLVVSGVMDIITLPEKDITSPLAGMDGEGAVCLEGTASVGGRLISIIRTGKLLDFQGICEAG